MGDLPLLPYLLSKGADLTASGVMTPLLHAVKMGESGAGNRESQSYFPDTRFPLLFETQVSGFTFTLLTHPKGTSYN